LITIWACLVVEAVNLPVVAAGGIGDGRGMAAAVFRESVSTLAIE